MTRRLFLFLICSLISIVTLYALWAYLGRSQTLPEPDLAPDHKLECVSYTPFMNQEKPGDLGIKFAVPRERLEKDFSLIAQRFSCIRLYFMDGLEEAPAVARQNGLKLIMSAWIGADPVVNEKEFYLLVRAVTEHPDVVKFVLIGNETLLRHEQTEEQMIEWIHRAKKAMPGAPVSYGEVLGFWKHYERLAEEVDFLTIHILPYWSDVPPQIDAVADYVEWDYNQMVTQYPGKKFFVGEIGWPSQGRAREHSVPSPVNEARFFRAVIPQMEKLGWHYSIIEAFDQPWKRSDEGCVGGYWGVFDENRQDKQIFAGPVSNEPLWRLLFVWSAGVAVVLMGIVFFVGAALAAVPKGQPRGLPLQMAVFFTTLAAFALVKQGREFQLSVFNTAVAVKAVLYLVLGFVGACLAVWICVTEKVPERMDWTRLEEAVKRKQFFSPAVWTNLFEQVVVFFLISISVSLVFVGRSQSFIGFTLLMPVLFILTRAFRNRGRERIYLQDFILGIALFVIVLCLANNERLWNPQANLWMLVCLAASVSLLQIFSIHALQDIWQRIRWHIISQYLAWFAFVWLATLLFRYGLMESRYCDLDVMCGANPGQWFCHLRAFMGISVAWKLWGLASVVILLSGVTFRSFRLTFIALLVALIGLIFYQNFPSAQVFVLALIYLGHRPK